MKSKSHWPDPKALLYPAFMAAFLGCAGQEKLKQPEPAAAQATAPTAVEQPVQAHEILMRMARFLAGTQRFRVTIQSNYDVVQESGQKIEFEENRTVTIDRPNGLRVEIEQSDGDRHLVLYDGKEITAFSPEQNVYAQSAKPGGIDEAVMYFLRDLHMRLPLAVMLVSSFPEEIEKRTLSLDFVETTEIRGTPVYHLAGRTETVDYQAWIETGERPLPLRVVLTYIDSEGQPQFRANFTDWNLAPEIGESLFAFTPPEGAHKIAFLAELPEVVHGANSPADTGGAQ